MAFELYRWTFPAIAASAIGAGQPVQFASGGAGSLERQVYPVGTSGYEPFGIALATANYVGATPPFSAAVGVVDTGNTIKVTAGASLGAGADVGVVAGASLTGWAGPVAGASGAGVWRVGKAVQAAAAGEVFGLYVSPRQLSGEP